VDDRNEDGGIDMRALRPHDIIDRLHCGSSDVGRRSGRKRCSGKQISGVFVVGGGLDEGNLIVGELVGQIPD
jgi:hypothetical protein